MARAASVRQPPDEDVRPPRLRPVAPSFQISDQVIQLLLPGILQSLLLTMRAIVPFQ